MDLDGYDDIVVGNSGEPNAVFMNSKEGMVWEKIQLRKENFNTYDIITADLNGDKRLDIIESNSDEVNRYYFNLKKK